MQNPSQLPAPVARVLDDLCGISEAEDILGVSYRRVQQMCAEGLIASRRIGPRVIVIYRPAVEAMAKTVRKPGPKKKS